MATIKRTIEEKAKRYDEAIEKARKLATDLSNGRNDRLYHIWDLETIFPELKESEDEKIRKDIIWCLKHSGIKEGNPINPHVTTIIKDAIAWLEKRGEQKPQRIVSAEAKEAMYNKPAWSEEDEAIYYGIIETEQYMLDVVNGIKKFNVGNVSIKEECTRELNWLKDLKDRVQPQPKQEWSEEDEEMCQETIDWFENKCFPYALESENPAKESIKWLKSLKDRYTWKPSDEQLNALHWCVMTVGSTEHQVLQELLEQLEKLKG